MTLHENELFRFVTFATRIEGKRKVAWIASKMFRNDFTTEFVYFFYFAVTERSLHI